MPRAQVPSNPAQRIGTTADNLSKEVTGFLFVLRSRECEVHGRSVNWWNHACERFPHAVIDPAGRIVAHLGLGIEGVLDAKLPAAMPPTFYARIGDIPTAIMMSASLLLVVRRRAAKR